MNYGPNQQPAVKVTIEYDCRNKRNSKTFDDVYAGRRFYTSKFKAGKNPTIKVKKGE